MITARQWVADAKRERLNWEAVSCPTEFGGLEMTVAAGLVELLAHRAGKRPPSWTEAIGATDELVILDPGLDQRPRSFARARTSGPEPLRKRNLLALPDFLDVA